MRLLLTGGTGFVGRALIRRLSADGHGLRCLVRSGSSGRLPALPGVEPVAGDVTEPAGLAAACAGCDAIIHLVGIIREQPRRGITFARLHLEATAHLLDAARAAGVQRFLHMSANGSRADAVTAYHRSKWAAEERVRASGLAWTLFRPSLILGAEGEFVGQLISLLRRASLLPVFGDGRYPLQPVAVEDVAAAFAAALERPATIGQTICLGGADRLSYDGLLRSFAAALGQPAPRLLHIPLALALPLVGLAQHLPGFPLTLDQLRMLLEGNVCADASGWAALGLRPTALADSLRRGLPRQD